MPNAANALQSAIYGLLSGDAALVALIGTSGIFDHQLTGKPMPYLVIAAIDTSDFGPGLEEHLVTIEAWSETEGRKQVQTMADRVKTLLHDAALTFIGATLVNL